MLQIWRIINNNEDSLWLQWVHKYFLRNSALWTVKIPAKSSWGLRKILNARDVAKNHVGFQIGRNSSILLWHDPWSGRPLIERLGRRVISLLESSTLAKVGTIIRDGEWCTGISNDCTVRVLHHICSNIVIHKNDELFWDGKPAKLVSLSIVWNGLWPSSTMPPWLHFVWCKYSVPRFSFITWLIVQERLLTKDRMVNFQMNVDRTCVMCGVAYETHEHLFCSCSFVQRVLSSWDISISSNCAEVQNGNICVKATTVAVEKDDTYHFVSAVFLCNLA